MWVKEKLLVQAISPFPTVLSKALYCRHKPGLVKKLIFKRIASSNYIGWLYWKLTPINSYGHIRVVGDKCVSWLSHTSANTTFFPKTTFLTCFRGERQKFTRKKVCLKRISNSQPPGHESDKLINHKCD